MTVIDTTASSPLAAQGACVTVPGHTCPRGRPLGGTKSPRTRGYRATEAPLKTSRKMAGTSKQRLTHNITVNFQSQGDAKPHTEIDLFSKHVTFLLQNKALFILNLVFGFFSIRENSQRADK